MNHSALIFRRRTAPITSSKSSARLTKYYLLITVCTYLKLRIAKYTLIELMRYHCLRTVHVFQPQRLHGFPCLYKSHVVTHQCLAHLYHSQLVKLWIELHCTSCCTLNSHWLNHIKVNSESMATKHRVPTLLFGFDIVASFIKRREHQCWLN